MKTGFIALILTLALASSAMAGDWTFQFGAPYVPPPAVVPVPPVTPIYPQPYPYGYSYFYLTPPQPYFGFSYDRRSRGRGHSHHNHRDNCPPSRSPRKGDNKFGRM